MSNVIDHFPEKPSEETQEEFSQTSEEQNFKISRAKRDEELIIKETVSDVVDEDGYKKVKTTWLIESGCCGKLLSFGASIHKPPGGRCQNNDCRAVLCQRCSEQELKCALCFRPLCRNCEREYKNTVLCKECFEQFKAKHEEETLKCLSKQ